MLTFCFGFDFFSTRKSKLCQNLDFPSMFEQIPCISKSKPCFGKSKPWIFKTNKFWFSFHFGVRLHSILGFLSLLSHAATQWLSTLCFNSVWYGTGHFYPYVFVRSGFVSWFFFSNSFKGEKWDQFGLFWHPAQLLKSDKSCPLVVLKMSIFLAFRSHARQGWYCNLHATQSMDLY